MGYDKMRRELPPYFDKDASIERSEAFREKVTKALDEKYDGKLSAFELKTMQYNTICDMFEPVLFYSSPFYYETGTMWAHCDGARNFRGHLHAGGWTYWKNEHKFEDQNPELWELMMAQNEELLFNGCYHDTAQHFAFNHRPIFEMGFSGIYEKAKKALETAETDKEKQYLNATCEVLLVIRRMCEKFADKADDMIASAPDEESRRNMKLISETARRVPWEKPETLYEALNTYAFMRIAIGTLEGVGPNSFGRLDYDLDSFYRNDIESGRLTKDEAYDLICKFLLTWDLRFDHDFKMVLYADHELENTYVIGGCDENGKPFHNDLTLMLLRASREENIIFPKIVARYSKNSAKEYLDEANIAVISSTSTLLFQNDDATIPALLRAGRPEKEAYDYLVTGCWGINGNGTEKFDNGFYVNLLKPLEFMLHDRKDKIARVGIPFKTLNDAESFDEVYDTYCYNIDVMFQERARSLKAGGHLWDQVDPLPLFSCTLEDCLENKKDYSSFGAKYNEHRWDLVGFPNVVDSLFAIKKLCFDEKKYTFRELLSAIRKNWDGFDDMRMDAIRCHGWGDGHADSSSFAAGLNSVIYDLSQKVTGTVGGKINISHVTYTEIRWWGEKTLATPDGRYSGDYFAQGLTPSRLKKIPHVTSVISALSALDHTEIPGNSVINIILPNKTTLDACEAFLRAASTSAMQSIQLNCTSREQLLDAQKHPEKYPTLIIRVCGFSAKFTSLSPEWQEEVLSRNFYE